MAKLAVFSPGTVSRVLNNKDKVNPEARAKVLERAHKIGLKPRATAQSKEVAVITDPHFTDRFRGYTSVLTAHVAFALSEKNVGMLLPPTRSSNFLIISSTACTPKAAPMSMRR